MKVRKNFILSNKKRKKNKMSRKNREERKKPRGNEKNEKFWRKRKINENEKKFKEKYKKIVILTIAITKKLKWPAQRPVISKFIKFDRYVSKMINQSTWIKCQALEML